jgi:aspartyl protease family protein
VSEQPNRGAPWLLLAVLAIGLTVLSLVNRENQVDFVRLLLLATVGGSALLLGQRLRAKTVLRHALTWIGVGLFLVILYSYRFELDILKDRVVGEIMPYSVQQTADGGISVRRSGSGHFELEARTNGVPIRFMVDTGASDIVLSPSDARRLGFDLSRLAFTRVYNTANGTVRGAPVTLDWLMVGGVRFRNVRASVNETAMDQSLLGMRFLERFRSYEVRDGILTLRW